MGRPLVLALAQVPAREPRDFDDFAAHARSVTRSHPNTQLLVYPEAHLCRDDDATAEQNAFALDAEPVGSGQRHELLSDLARELGVWLCPGSVAERGDDGHVYNTAVVYSPAGTLAAAYRKVFPWRPFEQARAGGEFVVFDIPETGRVGLSICYDAWFPEVARHLAWMGADLVLNVVKTPTVDREIEVVLARANAAVNQVFVASVNAAAPSGLGQSVLVGPEGQLLGQLPTATTGVLTAVIDLDAVRTVRTWGSFGITRPWAQFSDEDAAVALPLYGGRIDPATWRLTTERNGAGHALEP